jgi:hypothetical protein
MATGSGAESLAESLYTRPATSGIAREAERKQSGITSERVPVLSASRT